MAGTTPYFPLLPTLPLAGRVAQLRLRAVAELGRGWPRAPLGKFITAILTLTLGPSNKGQRESNSSATAEHNFGSSDPSNPNRNPKPPRPTKLRLAAITLLGPIIGTIALFLVQAIIEPPPVPEASDLLPIAAFTLFFGYFLGLLPAAFAAVVYSGVFSRATTRWRQFGLCLIVGAVTGALGILPPLWTFENAITFEPHFMALSGLAGAIALPATAMPFSRLPA